MKSFPTTSIHSNTPALPVLAEQHEKLNAVQAPEKASQVNCSATTVTELSYREILLMPTLWLWHGNLVVFGTNLVEKLKVEERPAQYDRAGILLKKAEYAIDCEYTLGGEVGRLTWLLACDLVTTRSIFYFGEKGKENFWFIPSVNSRTRIYSNQSSNADKLAPAWANAMASVGVPESDQVAAEHLYGGEAAATYAILLHMQGTNLPKATNLFEQLAVEAQQQSPQPWPNLAEPKTSGGRVAHEVTLREDRPANKDSHALPAGIRG